MLPFYDEFQLILQILYIFNKEKKKTMYSSVLYRNWLFKGSSHHEIVFYWLRYSLHQICFLYCCEYRSLHTRFIITKYVKSLITFYSLLWAFNQQGKTRSRFRLLPSFRLRTIDSVIFLKGWYQTLSMHMTLWKNARPQVGDRSSRSHVRSLFNLRL